MTDHISDFFAFARERHSIYLRRRAGLQSPWTEDPILRQYKFTNVFRELDRTTVWFREHVRDRLRDSPEVLLATVVFRWFNRIATGEAIFTQPGLLSGRTVWELEDWSVARDGESRWLHEVKNSILTYCGGGPYVTGAYIIKTPDGYNKLDGVLQCIEWFMEQSHEIHGRELHGKSNWSLMAKVLKDKTRAPLEDVWSWLRQFSFIGDFMAYEIVTDLRWTALLDQAPDILTWANPGPGATRGIGRVFHGDKNMYNQHSDKATLISGMRILLDASKDPEHWPQESVPGGRYVMGGPQDYQLLIEGIGAASGDWPSWEMRDVEHTLCEFDKYERARTGEGRPRGTFRS